MAFSPHYVARRLTVIARSHTPKEKNSYSIGTCVYCRQLLGVQLQMYRSESRVPYDLIFIAFYWFQILMHDHLLILTHTVLTLHTR